MDDHWQSQTVGHWNVYLLDLWIKDTSLFCDPAPNSHIAYGQGYASWARVPSQAVVL